MDVDRGYVLCKISLHVPMDMYNAICYSSALVINKSIELNAPLLDLHDL